MNCHKRGKGNYPGYSCIPVMPTRGRDQVDLFSGASLKFAVPVHGEYRHLQGQSQVAQQMGVPRTM